MWDPTPVDYTVLFVFPGFGSDRENAETIVQFALDWLNANKETPGFRFAQPVSAHLEMVQDADEARERIETEEDIAMIFVHDVPDDERDALLRFCHAQEVSACRTEEAPRHRGKREGPMKVVFGKRDPDRIPAHTLCAETLTDPLEDDEDDTGARVGEAIAVLALGVMQYHWKKRPPQRLFDLKE
jgi:hypothetical protein